MRRRIWEIVEVAAPGDNASRVFDISILSLIFLNVIAIVLESVASVRASYGAVLHAFDLFSVAVFTIEYVLRVWSCTTDERFARPISGRFRFALKPLSLVDLLAVAPFYLPFIGVDLRVLRVLRMFRILRIAKIGRYYTSLTLIQNVLRAKKEELALTLGVGAMLVVISSTVLYHCENPVQPEVFSSIPATMWWAVATLTTVGYGDMYPITVIGKIMAGIIAVTGIGMFALPTGILGAGFVDEIQRRRQLVELPDDVCPHCGERLANKRIEQTNLGAVG